MHIAGGNNITPRCKGRCRNTGVFQVSHLEPLGGGRDIERKRNQSELRAEMRQHGARALLTENLIHDVIQGRVATRRQRSLIGRAGGDVLIERQRIGKTLPAAGHINEHIQIKEHPH